MPQHGSLQASLQRRALALREGLAALRLSEEELSAHGAIQRVLAATLVGAAQPPSPRTYELGLVDVELYLSADALEFSWFFQDESGGSPPWLTVASMQDSLASALEAFPVLAGRAVTTGGGPGVPPPRPRTGATARGLLRAVTCCNQGASLLALDLTDCEYPAARIGATQLGSWPARSAELQGWNFAACQDDPEQPLLAVELLRFCNGSLLTVRSCRAHPPAAPAAAGSCRRVEPVAHARQSGRRSSRSRARFSVRPGVRRSGRSVRPWAALCVHAPPPA